MARFFFPSSCVESRCAPRRAFRSARRSEAGFLMLSWGQAGSPNVSCWTTSRVSKGSGAMCASRRAISCVSERTSGLPPRLPTASASMSTSSPRAVSGCRAPAPCSWMLCCRMPRTFAWRATPGSGGSSATSTRIQMRISRCPVVFRLSCEGIRKTVSGGSQLWSAWVLGGSLPTTWAWARHCRLSPISLLARKKGRRVAR